MIQSKIVCISELSLFQNSYLNNIPDNLNPIVFIEKEQLIWVHNKYYSIGDPSISISESGGVVTVSVGESNFQISTSGDALSIQKGSSGNSIIISSTALTKLNTDTNLSWNSQTNTISHNESGASAGMYGQQSVSGASVISVPYIQVDKYGHVKSISTSEVSIRDYTEQEVGSTEDDRTVLLSFNNSTDANPVLQANGLKYNNNTKTLTVEGGVNVGADSTFAGNVSVEGMIKGTLEGDITGEATPKLHLSETPEYGGASTALYGHVILEDTLSDTMPNASSSNTDKLNSKVTRGAAASPYMVWNAKNYLNNKIDSLPGIGVINVNTNYNLNILSNNQTVKLLVSNGLSANIDSNSIINILHNTGQLSEGSYGPTANTNTSIYVPNISIDKYGHISNVTNYLATLDYVNVSQTSNNANYYLTFASSTDTNDYKLNSSQYIYINPSNGSLYASTLYESGNKLSDIYAPISHASADAKYGTGTSTVYGHNKLSDSTTSTSDSNSGIASSPLAVSTALSTAKSYAQELFSANDSMVFCGIIDGSGVIQSYNSNIITQTITVGTTNISSLTSYNAGWTFKISSAGTITNIGNVVAGDIIICVNKYVSAYSASDFNLIQAGTDGLVISSNSLPSNQLVIGNGGKTVSYLPIGTSNQVLTVSSGIPSWQNNVDTWRPITVDSTQGLLTSDGKTLNFSSGTGINLTYADGTITIANTQTPLTSLCKILLYSDTTSVGTYNPMSTTDITFKYDTSLSLSLSSSIYTIGINNNVTAQNDNQLRLFSYNKYGLITGSTLVDSLSLSGNLTVNGYTNTVGIESSKGGLFYGQYSPFPTGLGTYVANYVSSTYGARILSYNGTDYQTLSLGKLVGSTFQLVLSSDGSSIFNGNVTTNGSLYSNLIQSSLGGIFYGQPTFPTSIGTYVLNYVSSTNGARVLAYDGTSYQQLSLGKLISGTTYQLMLNADGSSTFGGNLSMSNTNLVTNLNANYLQGYNVGGNSGNYGNTWNYIPVVKSDGVMEVGYIIDFHATSNDGIDFATRLNYNASAMGNTVILPATTGTLALLTDNVSSATKLQTSRTIWGQSFDGTGNVDGLFRSITNNIIDGTSISVSHKILEYSSSPYGLITRIHGTGNVSLQAQREANDAETFSLLLSPNGGNVGIRTTSPAYTLDVGGGLHTSAGYDCGGSVCFNTTSEQSIYMLNSSIHVGYYFNTTNIGMSDWGNNRAIWHYNISSNIFDVSIPSTFESNVTIGGILSITGAINSSANINIGTHNFSGTLGCFDEDRTLTSTYPNSYPTGLRLEFASAAYCGTGGNYAGVMNFSPYDGKTSSTGDASYQLAFGSTATNGSGTPQLRIRNGIDTTWNSWYDVLTSVGSQTISGGGLHLSNGWIYTSGVTGWYNETYNGGWYMSDTDWIRAQSNKSIYTGGSIEAGALIPVANNSYNIGAAANYYYNVYSSIVTTNLLEPVAGTNISIGASSFRPTSNQSCGLGAIGTAFAQITVGSVNVNGLYSLDYNGNYGNNVNYGIFSYDNIIGASDATMNLGSSAIRWRDIYTKNLHVNTMSSSTVMCTVSTALDGLHGVIIDNNTSYDSTYTLPASPYDGQKLEIITNTRAIYVTPATGTTLNWIGTVYTAGNSPHIGGNDLITLIYYSSGSVWYGRETRQ